MESWGKWQAETIWWSDHEALPRKICIRRFVKEGLTPFLVSKGYKLKRPTESIANDIANGLYSNKNKSFIESDWSYTPTNTEYVQEDLWHWGDVISDDHWSEFWANWGSWQDVSLDSYRGQDRRIDIQHYCWTQLDLDKSPASEYVNELYNYVEDENDVQQASAAPWKRAKEDSYLREAADSGEWGGYRR